MPKLPGVSQKEAMRALQKLGFWVARESGHVVMTNGTATVTIPRHSPINAYTMGTIV
jgi:predicted RNA binding protein YcfA (HicA-like mRNA interferase family)